MCSSSPSCVCSWVLVIHAVAKARVNGLHCQKTPHTYKGVRNHYSYSAEVSEAQGEHTAWTRSLSGTTQELGLEPISDPIDKVQVHLQLMSAGKISWQFIGKFAVLTLLSQWKRKKSSILNIIKDYSCDTFWVPEIFVTVSNGYCERPKDAFICAC